MEDLKFVAADKRVTSSIMTLAEYTSVLSTRAAQIVAGNMALVPLLSKPEDTARDEILKKLCPIIIVRVHTNGDAEKWYVREMTVPIGEM